RQRWTCWPRPWSVVWRCSAILRPGAPCGAAPWRRISAGSAVPRPTSKCTDGRWRRAVAAMAERPVLVINCGSASVRYQLREAAAVRCGGTIDGIGAGAIRWRRADGAEIPVPAAVGDHRSALEAIFDQLAAQEPPPVAIGHRVVHGGT